MVRERNALLSQYILCEHPTAYIPPSSRHHSYAGPALRYNILKRIPYDLLRNMINCRAHSVLRLVHAVSLTAYYSNAVENPTIYAEKKRFAQYLILAFRCGCTKVKVFYKEKFVSKRIARVFFLVIV